MKRYLVVCIPQGGGEMYNITYEQPKIPDNIDALPDFDDILNDLEEKLSIELVITNIIEIK